ncbi:caspase family protein [Candidatus Woesearchaeota archaeon]|nr:caspase family protein [Candidatus Woesearchaeota archaeon]
MPDKNKILVLVQRVPRLQHFMISGATHLGRSSEIAWKVPERQMPDEFGQLELGIKICGTSISRNHAGIIRRDDDYLLMDLNSRNGTEVIREWDTGFGRKDINPGRNDPVPLKLERGDTIILGKDFQVSVDDIIEEAGNNHALLVGADGGNLRGVKNDLDNLAYHLARRGYAGNITRLYNGQATKPNVKAALEKAAYTSTSGSHFLFFYSGHGGERGLHLGCFRNLKPAELYQSLSNIRGKKAAVLDCCHSGIFVHGINKLLIPDNTLVLAACAADKRAYEGRSPIMAGSPYMGRFTEALVHYLHENRGNINLQDFKAELERKMSNTVFKVHYQEPRAAGTSFSIVEAHTCRDEQKFKNNS